MLSTTNQETIAFETAGMLDLIADSLAGILVILIPRVLRRHLNDVF